MNNSSHSGGQSTLDPPREIGIAVVSLMSIAILTATLGNARVCLVLRQRHDLRKVPLYLYANLSIVGLLAAVTSMPAVLVSAGVHYLLDGVPPIEIICKIGIVTSLGLNFVNCFILSLMAIDRYDCIAHPFNRRLESRNIRLAVFIMWIIAAILASVIAVSVANEKLVCSRLDPYKPTPFQMHIVLNLYRIVVQTALNILTFVIIIVTFFRIVRILRSSSLTRSKSLHQKYENQLTKLTFQVGAAFVIFGIPIMVSSAITHAVDSSGKTLATAKLFSVMVSSFHFVANPFFHLRMFKNKARNAVVRPVGDRRN